ncbi:hypothetical protein SLEP1_g24443 [Rubroshorea leprosula]|uniref:Uncharacterized protein n=1 Tax=Rubroshorea leprosula TaxID=152421 RepID=A0AAV5JLT4_9ROSI|nr:hypothetical protein SLEP1_g24443 [Rubroshorea leprosula]
MTYRGNVYSILVLYPFFLLHLLACYEFNYGLSIFTY